MVCIFIAGTRLGDGGRLSFNGKGRSAVIQFSTPWKLKSMVGVGVGGNWFHHFIHVQTFVMMGLGRRISLACKIPSYLLLFYLFIICKTMVWKHKET